MTSSSAMLEEMDIDHCKLISGRFALLVQFFLLCVVTITLYLKWIYESNRRPFIIWVLDSLKQSFGAGMGHLATILMALLLAKGHESEGTQCAWYFVEHTLGVFFGIPLKFGLLKLFEATIGRNLPQRGEYYHELSLAIDYRQWAFQTFTWGGIVILENAILLIPYAFFENSLSQIGEAILSPLHYNPKAELVFVMIFWPAICTSIQFYVVASFLRRKWTSSYESVRTLPEQVT